MSLLLLLLASYGVCFGLMAEKIPALNRALYAIPVARDEEGNNLFRRMFLCAYCTGFHSGWIVWLISRGLRVGWADLTELAVFTFAASAFCYSLDITLQWLER
jgi:hypothetical protein